MSDSITRQFTSDIPGIGDSISAFLHSLPGKSKAEESMEAIVQVELQRNIGQQLPSMSKYHRHRSAATTPAKDDI